MSDTSEALASAWQSIKDLRSGSEKGPGEKGDQFGDQMDVWVDSVLGRFGAIVNANDEVVAPVNNDSTTTGSLSVGGTQYHPPQTVLDHAPPSDGTTQTFDLQSELINNFGIGMYKVEFRAKHTQEGWTGSRSWWGDMWFNVGYQGSPTSSDITSIKRDIVPFQVIGPNTSGSINDGVVSYSTTLNYFPNLVIKVVNIA